MTTKADLQRQWATIGSQHYRDNPLALPPQATDRKWSVWPLDSWEPVELIAETEADLTQAILALKPVQVKYSTIHRKTGEHLETALAFKGDDGHHRASLVPHILRNELGVPVKSMQFIDAGNRTWTVVVSHPLFQGKDTRNIRRLLSYFHDEGFLPPNGRILNGNQQRYQAAVDDYVAALLGKNPAHLRDHLSNKTPLGQHYEAVFNFLHDTEEPAKHLDEFKELQAWIHQYACQTAFSRPDVGQLTEPWVALPGTVNLVTGQPVTRIPLGRKSA